MPIDSETFSTIRDDVARDSRTPPDRYDLEQARREIELLRGHRRMLFEATQSARRALEADALEKAAAYDSYANSVNELVVVRDTLCRVLSELKHASESGPATYLHSVQQDAARVLAMYQPSENQLAVPEEKEQTT